MKTAVQAVLVSRRHPEPCRAGDAGFDSRRRRAGLLAGHAFGAAFDNPGSDRRVRRRRRRSGDRARSRQLALEQVSQSGHDGAVLPILHLNGYKIANPTVLARITRDELEQLLRGYGYEPYFVEGDDPAAMHQLMARDARHGRRTTSSAIQQRRARRTAINDASALADDRPAHAERVDRAEGRRRQARSKAPFASHQVPLADPARQSRASAACSKSG